MENVGGREKKREVPGTGFVFFYKSLSTDKEMLWRRAEISAAKSEHFFYCFQECPIVLVSLPDTSGIGQKGKTDRPPPAIAEKQRSKLPIQQLISSKISMNNPLNAFARSVFVRRRGERLFQASLFCFYCVFIGH